MAQSTHQILGKTVKALEREVSLCRKASEELRKRTERFRVLADLAYDWEYWIGLEGEYLYVSPSCERISGYPPDGFLNNPELLKAIIHPDDLATLSQHLEDELQNGDSMSLDFRIITRSGDERWIAHTCRRVRGMDGDSIGRRAVNRDITERKRTEEALGESEDRYRKLFNDSRDAIYMTSRGGKFLDVNRATLELFGYTREEMVGRLNVRDIYAHPHDREEFQEEIERRGLREIVAVYSDETERQQNEETLRLTHDQL